VLEVRDLVVGEVQDAQGGILFQAGEVGHGVVGEVELFEVGEVGEACQVGETVGLDGDDAKVG
jgi:type IV secretory pathway ATPase VirB11/archaellum biosynthesis ATPase